MHQRTSIDRPMPLTNAQKQARFRARRAEQLAKMKLEISDLKAERDRLAVRIQSLEKTVIHMARQIYGPENDAKERPGLEHKADPQPTTRKGTN